MNYFKKVILIYFITLLMLTVNAPAKVRVLFYYVKNEGGMTLDDIRVFTRSIKSDLRKNAKIDLVFDDELEQIFEDHGISKSGCTSTACALKIMNDERIGASYAMYGKMYRNEEGMICMEATAVSAKKKSVFWETEKIYKVPSKNQISLATYAIVEEFAENLEFPIRISNIINNSVFIDAGADLGIKYGQSYYVVNEDQFGPHPEDTIIDTLGKIKVTIVNPAFSEAKIIEKRKPFVKYARVIIEKHQNNPPIIVHSPVTNWNRKADLPIEAEISDDRKVEEARIFYKTEKDIKYKSIILEKKLEENNIYIASIPYGEYKNNKNLQYYLFAKDNTGKKSKLKNPEGFPFKVKLTIDNKAPQIIYSNPKNIITANRLVQINPKVIDDVGIKGINIFYKFNPHSNYKQLPLEKWGPDSWGISIRIPEHRNVLIYYLKAEDSNNNIGYFGNETSPFKIKILVEDKTPPKISNIQFYKSGRFGNKFTFSTRIVDDYGIEKSMLYYSMKPRNGKAEKQQYAHLSKTVNNTYQSPIFIDTTIYQSINFKIEATDINKNTAVKYYKIGFYQRPVKDSSPPRIMHYFPQNICMLPDNYQNGGEVIYTVIFTVKDNIGISTVKAHIRKLDSKNAYNEVVIPRIGGNSYGAFIKGPENGIELYLEAIDSNHNESYMGSSTNPFKIKPELKIPLPKAIKKQF